MTYNLSNIDQLNRTEPPYLGAYGLREAPFSEQHDDRFFYLYPALADQLDLLKHYTQYGNLLLLVKGEHGIGKSSLRYRFVDTAPEEWQICEIQADTMMTSSMLLKDIAMGFGITEPPHAASVLFEVLNSQLEYLHKDSYEPILIIDDAHELPLDALQSLLHLAEHHSNPQTALRIILFCEPEIDVMLDDPSIHALKDQITHSIEIPHLDETQTAEYLKHRLAVSGFDGTSPFSPALIHKIYFAAAGIPSKTNESAHQVLCGDNEPEEVTESEPEEKPVQAATLFTLRNMLLGGFALAAVLAVLIFQDNINTLFEEPEIISVQTKEQKTNEQINQVVQTESPPEAAVVNPIKTIELTLPHDNQTETDKDKTTDVVADKNREKIEQAPPEVKAITTTPAKPTLELSSVNPNPVATSKQRQIISISGQGFHKRQQVKVSWTDNEKILAENQVNITSDTYMNLILNVGSKTDTWSVTVTDPLLNIVSNTISFNVIADKENKNAIPASEKAPSSNITQTRSEKTNGFYGHDWIKQQNKNNYTLQLLGTFNKTTPAEYLKKFSLKDDAAVFSRNLKGKNWYTLIYGSFPSKSAAEAAAKNLPKGVAEPWARSFASIASRLPKTEPVNKTKNIKPITNSSGRIPDNKEGWLWSQDPRHYTLQLTAGTNEKAIQRFITRNKLQGKTASFSHIRDGKNWTILVYGSFTDSLKAKQAISQLPTEVQKARPWARSFGAIHAELN
jgi:septal ring-binding cell division protein DamX/type II secretory pathway predicted ATPase ExeA